MVEETLDRVRARCVLSTKLWGRTFSGLTCVTFRERGADALHKLWFDVLCGHQVGHYHEGLKLLGIDKDPPAIAAAKYHYLTNQIGGLDMEYVEESPKKVWIRYVAPMWTYNGVALLALPGRVRRTIFSAWHPRNGQLMGCPRLGYVGTKFIMEGDPYDEGYFLEYDRDLAPGEIMRYEVVHKTPEFDPSKAPKLDPKIWPEARLLKAQRNFSGGYVATTVEMLGRTYGEYVTNFIVGETARMLAVQYIHELKAMTGVAGKDVGAIASLFATVLDACYQDFTAEKISPTRHRIALRSYRPFGDDASEDLRAAFFQFQSMGTRILNGRVKATRHIESLGGAKTAEIWDFEDTGRWLY
ncbi:MAG: hypothetical protein ACKVSF_10435 [Alphaproteobacteria bacterium]